MDTDLRLAVTAAIRTLLAERPETFDPRSYLTAGREAVREMVRHKIRAVLGSSGQA
ncbi:MAG: class II fructose-bisphosphate aldolase [Bilophila wadsworthia]